MSVAHHPSDGVIAQYAAGTLADGPSLVAAAHLERCGHCRARVKLFEAVGGALIEELPPATMNDDALALALAKIERPAPAPPGASAPRRAEADAFVKAHEMRRRVDMRGAAGGLDQGRQDVAPERLDPGEADDDDHSSATAGGGDSPRRR